MSTFDTDLARFLTETEKAEALQETVEQAIEDNWTRGNTCKECRAFLPKQPNRIEEAVGWRSYSARLVWRCKVCTTETKRLV